MPDLDTPTVLTSQRVTFWDSDLQLVESRDLAVELRNDSTIARITLPITDPLAQRVLDEGFDAPGPVTTVTIDRDGQRWAGRIVEFTLTDAAGVRVVELRYLDHSHKSEFVKLLEAL